LSPFSPPWLRLCVRCPQQATVAYGKNYNQRKILDLFLDLNYFSFSNANSNPKHLTKHQTLSPNHQISIRGGTGSELPESTPAGFCVFLSDPDPGPESKICEKPDPVSSEISDFPPCTHAQSNILHIKYVDKTDY